MPPLFSGFICAYHPAAPGSSPKHTIYAFISYSQIVCFICHVKRTNIKGRVWPIFKKKLDRISYDHKIFNIWPFPTMQICLNGIKTKNSTQHGSKINTKFGEVTWVWFSCRMHQLLLAHILRERENSAMQPCNSRCPDLYKYLQDLFVTVIFCNI